MENSLLQTSVSILMLLVVAVLFLAWRRFMVTNSERRLLAMLEAVGLDPEMASSGDMPTIMSEVRQRCRHCQSEAVCERWLEGNESGDNQFCPNSRVFEVLRKFRPAVR